MSHGSGNEDISIMKLRFVPVFIQKAIKSNLTQRFKVFKQDSGSKRNTYTVSNNLFVLQFL
jgi:hypothetical protein